MTVKKYRKMQEATRASVFKASFPLSKGPLNIEMPKAMTMHDKELALEVLAIFCDRVLADSIYGGEDAGRCLRCERYLSESTARKVGDKVLCERCALKTKVRR